MPKYYVESGPVQLVLSARFEAEAAVRAFQWTCDQQAMIEADTPLEHVQVAEARGIQMHDHVWVNERGFGRRDAWRRTTLEVVDLWLTQGQPME